MTSPRVARARRTEAAVAAAMRLNGWPHAERVPASLPGADITGAPDVAIEVKARSDFNPRQWLRQAEANADGRLPICVVRCNGQGEAAGDYLAMVRFRDLLPLLVAAGYGDADAVEAAS